MILERIKNVKWMIKWRCRYNKGKDQYMRIMINFSGTLDKDTIKSKVKIYHNQ
jgi:hypothetical protein